MAIDFNSLEGRCINTIRALSMDAVEKAASGHPGAPMGLAPLGYVLFRGILKHNPENPKWINRDRFILSAGHASMWLYSLLYLSGYKISLSDIKSFRQWESKTPGHPEYGVTPGVETTTGPLGQGFANAVGMAIAEKHLAAKFNKPLLPVIDHFTFVVSGDGDMMEGISSEAASLAGHLELSKLICFYDANNITIDGKTDLAMSEDVEKRFSAYGWQVLRVSDGNHDLDGIRKAVSDAQNDLKRPSLIIIQTTIGFGSPAKGGSEESHGAPLGRDEISKTKANLNWPLDKDFFVPDDVLSFYRETLKTGEKKEEEWKTLWAAYKKDFPKEFQELNKTMSGSLPEGWQKKCPLFQVSDGPIATRSASGKVLNALADAVDCLVGGSADLTGSNNTFLKGKDVFCAKNPSGRNIHFGVREHAMGAIINGILLHKGLKAYGGTFLIFSDYMKPPLRLASLMRIPSIFVFTHDSIGLGEDGPTHQPVEQLAALRAIPGFCVIRPADANEVSVAWQSALESNSAPTAIVLTRQNLPVLDRKKYAPAQGLRKGAYVLYEGKRKKPDLVILASGSEVHLALESAHRLEKENIVARVVSFPSWELFMAQPSSYRARVLTDCPNKLAIETGCSQGWEKFIGDRGDMISMTRFGASAPAKELFSKFGFTSDNVVKRAKKLLKSNQRTSSKRKKK